MSSDTPPYNDEACTHDVGADGPHGLKGFAKPPFSVDCVTRRRFEKSLDYYSTKRGVDRADRSTLVTLQLDDAALGAWVRKAFPIVEEQYNDMRQKNAVKRTLGAFPDAKVKT